MTTTLVVLIVLTCAAVIAYAIHKGLRVKAGMKWLGLSVTFEAEKDEIWRRDRDSNPG